MASINGDWFHSRVSSNLSELLTVRILVLESQKPEYIGFRWSGGRLNNRRMYQFSGTANIQPPQMQTKIRAMIRYGFVRDGSQCPLVWTRMGNLWNDLYTIGNYDAAQEIYELILTISLAIYAFNNTAIQYSINPANGEMPLKFLLNILDKRNSISLHEFSVLVDGNTKRIGSNTSYWRRDLINSGLFYEKQRRLFYTGKYLTFINEIRKFKPNPLLTDDDWKSIRDNPLIELSPFKNSIRLIFETITQEQNREKQPLDEASTEPIINTIAEQEESQIPEIDILSNDLKFSKSSRRIRNATWSTRIKKKYKFLCVIPNCDVTGQLFVEAAHIKPDSIPDGEIPHRAHILNGLCLCRHCHIAFEKGYFSLTDDCKVITSVKFNDIPNQNLKTIILSSSNKQIKSRIDKRMPLIEFIQYHRTKRFKE